MTVAHVTEAGAASAVSQLPYGCVRTRCRLEAASTSHPCMRFCRAARGAGGEAPFTPYLCAQGRGRGARAG